VGDGQALQTIGRIIVADDSKLNLELIKLNLAEVGVTENVTYCSDGK
jgi:CheY-like chemotaxis protein